MRDSNPGYMATSVGGVTRNILENLARQGVSALLLSAVSDDLYGEKIVRDSEAAGIDMSHLRLKKGMASSSYIAILDERGDMLLGMSDMRIIEDMPPAYLDANRALLQSADAIVCDACLPIGLLDHLVSAAAGDTPVLIDPVSTAYARQMEPIVGKFFRRQAQRDGAEHPFRPADRDGGADRARLRGAAQARPQSASPSAAGKRAATMRTQRETACFARCGPWRTW